MAALLKLERRFTRNKARVLCILVHRAAFVLLAAFAIQRAALVEISGGKKWAE